MWFACQMTKARIHILTLFNISWFSTAAVVCKHAIVLHYMYLPACLGNICAKLQGTFIVLKSGILMGGVFFCLQSVFWSLVCKEFWQSRRTVLYHHFQFLIKQSVAQYISLICDMILNWEEFHKCLCIWYICVLCISVAQAALLWFTDCIIGSSHRLLENELYNSI